MVEPVTGLADECGLDYDGGGSMVQPAEAYAYKLKPLAHGMLSAMGIFRQLQPQNRRASPEGP